MLLCSEEHGREWSRRQADNGQLVLNSKESQMIANVALPVDSEMKFTLTGGPPADPGLDFKKR